MRAGVYVDLLSFFSAAAGNPQPITPADAVRVARAQQAAMAAAPGGTASLPPTGSRKGVSLASVGAAALVVAIAGLAVATPALLRRRHQRLEQLDATR